MHFVARPHGSKLESHFIPFLFSQRGWTLHVLYVGRFGLNPSFTLIQGIKKSLVIYTIEQGAKSPLLVYNVIHSPIVVHCMGEHSSKF
jgi:hypothetical protein